METFKAALESFNRFFLRYGPPSMMTFVFTLGWLYVYKLEYGFPKELSEIYRDLMKNSLGYLLIALLLFSISLSVVLSWPICLLHVFRASREEIEALAKERDRLIGLHRKEYVDTFRHCREYGNQLAGIGFSLLQLFFLLNEFFYSQIMFESLWTIVTISVLAILVGLLIWFRGVYLEKTLLRTNAKSKFEGSHLGRLKKDLFGLLGIASVEAVVMIVLVWACYTHSNVSLFASVPLYPQGSDFRICEYRKDRLESNECLILGFSKEPLDN